MSEGLTGWQAWLPCTLNLIPGLLEVAQGLQKPHFGLKQSFWALWKSLGSQKTLSEVKSLPSLVFRLHAGFLGVPAHVETSGRHRVLETAVMAPKPHLWPGFGNFFINHKISHVGCLEGRNKTPWT